MPESMDNKPYLHCSRCDSEKREMKFSTSWRRSRRPTSKIAVAAL
jgi:hypothetical protein